MARVLKFRARSCDGYFQDHIFELSIFPKRQDIPIGDHHIRQHIEIEGIDITDHLLDKGVTFQNSLDLVRLNTYVVSDCNIPLRNDDGFFRNDIPNNFWQSNDLNPSGFLNRVEVFVAFLIDGTWQSFLFFQGQITALQMPLSPTSTLRCFSNTARLTQFELEQSGVGIEKIAELTTSDTTSKTPVVEGVYIPERGLAPLTAATVPEAYHHQDTLTLKEVVNDALGIKDNTGYLSASDLRTQGGILEDPILLNFKTAYRYRSVREAFEKLTKIENSVISFHPDFEDLPLVDPHISVCGNIQFNTELGRITRLPTDWIYNPFSKSLYILLSNSERHILDQLVEYRLESDTYHVLHEFDSNVTCYRLASADFDTFYILAGASTDLDRSDPESADSERFALGLDSSVEPSEIQILTYIKSESWVETFIDANSTSHRPQLGIHYHVGFANRDFAWQGNAPSRYSTFGVHNGYLYYRYATETEFGIAQADPDGNTVSLLSAVKDGYENHLNFAFTLDTDGTVYFAWTQGTAFGSTLHIEKYDRSETTEILKIRRSILELSDRRASGGGGSPPAGNGLRAGSLANPRLSAEEDISEDAGAFLGVHEMVFSRGFLYLVVPIVRGNRDIDKSAGSVLYRFGLDTLTLEKLDTSDFVHFGFAGLIEHTETGDTPHEKAVYYVRSPAACYKYPAYNPDLGSFDSEDEQNYLSEFRGNLKRVLPTGTVEDCGTIRFDNAGAFRGLLCRSLVFDEALHLMVAQGAPETVLQRESVVSELSGVLWCVFGRKLHFTLDMIPASGTLDAALSKMASQVNATFGMDRNIAILENRSPIGAILDNSISEANASITFRSLNRSRPPDEGFVLVDHEIIGYAGVYNNQLTNLARGVAKTEPSVHVADTEITFLNDVISKNEIVEENIYWKVDTAHLYNTIKDENELIKIKDELSLFDEKLLTLNMDLDALKIPWIEFVAANYLHRFKDLRFLINFQTQASYHLKIGDVVGFNYAAPIPPIAIQIMSAEYGMQSTAITGREVRPDIDKFLDTVVVDPDETYRIVDVSENPILVDGAGENAIFGGAEEVLLPIPMTLDAEIEDIELIQYEAFEPIRMPAGRYGAPPYTYQMTGIPENTYFDRVRREFYGTPDDAQGATEYTYIVKDKNGITHRSTKTITVNPVAREIQRILDSSKNLVLTDGAGNVAIFRGY